jgi:hypothetical protein
MGPHQGTDDPQDKEDDRESEQGGVVLPERRQVEHDERGQVDDASTIQSKVDTMHLHSVAPERTRTRALAATRPPPTGSWCRVFHRRHDSYSPSGAVDATTVGALEPLLITRWYEKTRVSLVLNGSEASWTAG